MMISLEAKPRSLKIDTKVRVTMIDHGSKLLMAFHGPIRTQFLTPTWQFSMLSGASIGDEISGYRVGPVAFVTFQKAGQQINPMTKEQKQMMTQ
jgi:hypothetical protein